MPPVSSRSDIHLEAEPLTAPRKPADETPLRILLIGDFTGRSNRRLHETNTQGPPSRPIEVDRDNFDEVLERLAPALDIPLGGDDGMRVGVRFRELDDFHPDNLYRRVSIFQHLRQTRARLDDPATFQAAARELGLLGAGPEPARSAPPEPAPRPAEPPLEALTGGGLLEQMMESTESRTSDRPSGRPDELQSFIRKVVQPHLVERADPRRSEVIAQLDASVADQMRDLLHHPDFQRLEAAWRGLFFLIRRLETGTDLKVYLLDYSREDVAADLNRSKDLAATSQLYRLVVRDTVETPGADPWSVLVGLYEFSDSPQDVQMLARLAKVAQTAGAPFLAGAKPKLAGCDTLAGTPDPRDWDATPNAVWEALRAYGGASSIGLALPRFLLRMPYGRESQSIDAFDFEEMRQPPRHEDYLWGNPAILLAALMGEAFSRYGWNFYPDMLHDVEGLPLHVYRQAGESVVKPCAEALLTERAIQALADRGLVPVASFSRQDKVRVVRFQSIAYPSKALAGRWVNP